MAGAETESVLTADLKDIWHVPAPTVSLHERTKAHGRRTVSFVTLEKKPEKKATEERIAELKQELKKAELAVAIETAGTLNTMEATGDSPEARLEPTDGRQCGGAREGSICDSCHPLRDCYHGSSTGAAG